MQQPLNGYSIPMTVMLTVPQLGSGTTGPASDGGGIGKPASL
jgi:hypothetical protein